MSVFDVKNVPMYPTRHMVVTPNDSVTFDSPMIIRVLTTGNVAVADLAGTVVTYTGVPAYSDIPVMCSKLMATNTTATSFVGIYGSGA